MALTKPTSQINDWTVVAQNTIGKSAIYDASGDYESLLCIQAFLDTMTAHTGTEFRIQISSNTTGDEDWHDFGNPWIGLVGTAATDLIENNPLDAGSTVITLTGHALTALGIWKAIKDGTLADSELFYQVASDENSITLLDGTTNAHVVNTPIFNVAISPSFLLPISVRRVRLIVNNTYDNDGSTLNYKVRISPVTRI